MLDAGTLGLSARELLTLFIATHVSILTSLAAKIAGEPKKIVKYLGIMMIPQGGVALEMAILAELRFAQVYDVTGDSMFEEIGQTIFAVVLFAVIVYKVIGEIVVKYAFKHAEEITEHHDDHIPHVI